MSAVRAAGVACLIGLGLSVGTLLLYRLYFRIVVPFLNSVWRDRGHADLDDEYTLYLVSQTHTPFSVVILYCFLLLLFCCLIFLLLYQY